MPAVAKHRNAILDASIELFRRRGYSSTGLNAIVEASGAPKGSVYHYFPEGKASIAEAAILRVSEWLAESLSVLARDSNSAKELIVAHCRVLEKWMRKSKFKDGCPISSALLELAPDNRAVTEAGRVSYALRHKVIKDKIVSDGVAPEKAERLAVLCTAALQGALIQARVDKSTKPLRSISQELSMLLGSLARS
jgi:TetR/AcrR family transcriptional repressor of lmrAB and yxaGH operons